MGRVLQSVEIARPIEEVFAVLTEVEQTGDWFPGNVEEHWTSPPPHGVGSTRHAVIRMLGRTSENDAVVEAYDPPHLAAMRGRSEQAPFLAVLRFAPTNAGTRVDVDVDLEFRGALRIVGPLFVGWYGRQWAQGLLNLKRAMEAGEIAPV